MEGQMQLRFTHIFAVASLAFGFSIPLQAATFTPNVFDDPAPVAAPNGCTGLGSNPTRCSLREAALSANASAGEDEIILGEGPYQLTIPEAGTPESGDLDFVEGVDFGITLQGQGPDLTKIQASAGLNDRLVGILGTSVNMTLQGITFEGGNVTGDGGGVYYSIGASDPNDFNIFNCSFLNNTASGNGGAVYLSSGNPIVNIDGGTYAGNRSTGGSGGALYLSHGGSATDIDIVKNIVLTDNQALSGSGGSIFQSASKGVSFTNIQVTDSRADSAGGMAVGNGGSPLGLEIIDSNISNNTATDGDGGGFTASTSGRVRVVNSTVAGNSSAGSALGGGGSINNGGGLQILGSTFSGNSATYGGGLFHDGTPGFGEITNSTFSGNEASGDGGGLHIDQPGLELISTTVANNSAGGGGGIFNANAGTIVLRNDIFTGNSSTTDTDDCGGGFFNSQGLSIFGSPDNANCQPDGFPLASDPEALVADPLIGELQDNGGPTFTHNLLAGSPALDAVPNGDCVDESGADLLNDQRGFIRPSDTACDIGSVEAAETDLQIAKTADDENYFVGDQITYTLTVTNNGPGISQAIVSDQLPSGVSLVSIGAGCSESSGLVTCELGDLDPSASAAVTIVVEATTSGTVENTATVSGADIDTDPANDSSSVTVNVLSEDTGGGCNLGGSGQSGSGMTWALLGAGLASLFWLRRPKKGLLAFLLGGVVLMGATSAQAANFAPNVFDDPTPVAAPNGCTGQGSNPTRCSLREAVLSSNANNEADTITLAEGQYDLTIPEAGTPESGDLDFSEGDVIYTITLQGAGSSLTKIVASDGLGERIAEFQGADINVSLTGITFENGNSPGSGGGVFFSSGNTVGANDPIVVRDCAFLNNQSASEGGGGFFSGSSPLIDLDGVRFEGNIAGLNGGGASFSGGSSILATTVKNAVVLNNRAIDGNGGGLYQSASNGAKFDNILAEGNQARNPSAGPLPGRGGGIYCSNGASSPNISCEIANSVLRNNLADGASGAGGGGFYGSSGGLFRIVNTTVEDNVALNNSDGGGIYVINGGGLQILASAFVDNQAESGGGIYYDGVSAAINEITNSTISENEATGLGGGIYSDVTGDFSLNNLTIVGNSATTGGGSFAFGPQPTVQNSIFTDNSSNDGSADCGSQLASEGYNTFASADNAGCDPNGIPAGDSPNDSTDDPLLGPLADNGGPTQTYALLEGSPAIDGGNPAGCEDGQGDPLTTDQRGFVRPAGPQCDIGAVEMAVTDLSIEKTADGSSFIVGDEIVYSITVSNDGPDISPALVTDTLPAQVSLVSLDAGCSESGGTVTCDLGTLDPGESASFEIVVEAIADGTVTNTATVAGADIDTDPANNSSTVSVNVISNDTGGGGCRIGASSPSGSPWTWALLALGIGAISQVRRRSTH
jgi:uncharacterized repeat protein (TIGR01451 family)